MKNKQEDQMKFPATLYVKQNRDTDDSTFFEAHKKYFDFNEDGDVAVYELRDVKKLRTLKELSPK